MDTELRPCFARSREEHEAAFRLLHDAYSGAGFIVERPSGLYVPPFLVAGDGTPVLREFRTAVVWASCAGGRQAPAMTATLIPDDGYGLPCEEIFPAEVAGLRSYGRLVEVTSLAAEGTFDFRLAHEELSRLVVQYALVGGRFDGLVIVVHPQHARYYSRRLAFRSSSRVKAYDRLHTRPPGLLMRLIWREASVAEPEKARRLSFPPVERACLDGGPDEACRRWLLASFGASSAGVC